MGQESHSYNWFVRRGDTVTGPFPGGLISRHILLGRIGQDDELSHDRLEWTPVARLPELVPDVLKEAMANPSDEEAQERLAAARRWADERGESDGAPSEERRAGQAVGGTTGRRRSPITGESGPRPVHYLALAIVLAVVVAVPFMLPAGNVLEQPDCTAAAAPGVNWSNCLLTGSQLANANLSGANLQAANLRDAVLRAANLRGGKLAYADFTGANLRGANLHGASLVGANLRGADLTRADLAEADLSYAILEETQLAGAKLAGARFDYAEQGNGIVCMPGSVGRCRPGRVSGR